MIAPKHAVVGDLPPRSFRLGALGGVGQQHRVGIVDVDEHLATDLAVAAGGDRAVYTTAGGGGYVLLGRTASWHPELRYLVAAATLLAVVGLLLPARTSSQGLVPVCSEDGSFT